MNKEKKVGALYGEVKFLIRQRKITERQIKEKKDYYHEIDSRINEIMTELERINPKDFVNSTNSEDKE